jgi:8-oxo-dGTP diphosphatase
MRDGQLLLLRRANEPWLGRWDIPGGFCEPDEHPVETAVREAREECGFEVEVTGLLGMWLDRYPNPAECGSTATPIPPTPPSPRSR